MNESIRYFSLSNAHAEICRRAADAHLRQEVAEFLGDNLLAPLAGRPRAVFFRSIASPDHAFGMFWYFAKHLGLAPMCMEFHEDVFSGGNDDKMQLVRPLVYDASGLRYVGLSSRSAARNQSFIDIRCWDGRPLVGFHHDLFRRSEFSCELFEASSWFKSIGNAKDYYPYLFAHFIAHGVQIEYYDVEHSRSEASWVADVVASAFESTKVRFGLDPIVVQLCPDGLSDEEYRFYWLYPATINQFLLDLSEEHLLPTFPYKVASDNA